MSLLLKKVRLALDNFSLQIDANFDQPIIGLFGPSGSGKTTLLEVIAGLRHANSGIVQLDAEILSDHARGFHRPPRQRRIGYVPQDLALFPHLSVRKNLLYGQRREPDSNALFTIQHVSEVMEITSLHARDVTALSGGEQQRVAFARAILSAPRLLLLDEPMSSLDSRLKRRLVPFLHRIRDEFHIPLIYVTHDAAELNALCQEVLLIENGSITARGAPADLLAEVSLG